MLMARSASAVRATFALPVEMQPALFTLTPRVSVPLGPPVKVIDGVPWPAVMLPFVIDQAYVVPAGPAGTDAVWPGEPAGTLGGAGVGTVAPVALGTVFEAGPPQPA